MSISQKIKFYISEIDELEFEWNKKFFELRDKINSDSNESEYNKLRICKEQILLMKKLRFQLNQYSNRFFKWEE